MGETSTGVKLILVSGGGEGDGIPRGQLEVVRDVETIETPNVEAV